MSPLATLGIAFVVLTIMGVPLFVAVGLTTALALFLIDIPYTLMAQTGYGSLTPFPLLTIPLFVLAGRLSTGSLFGVSSDETSNATLFFTGGGGSVRGYGYQTIGVDVPGTGTIGGLSVLEGSVELRRRFGESFGMVGFYDFGLVGSDTLPDLDGDYRTSIGLGARFHTNFGPIRFDIARGLDRKADDPFVGIYVGLGQAF